MFNITSTGISLANWRSNRLSFFLALIFSSMGFMFNIYIWPKFLDITDNWYKNIILLLDLPFVIIILSSTVNRFHDMNKTAWFMLLQFIPFLNIWILIWLLVWKWTKWKNIYGNDPLDKLVKI